MKTPQKTAKAKFPAEVVEIFSQLKSDEVKLSMLKEATMIKKLASKFHIKPTVIQKQTKLSLPHVYNLINLASISPKMKSYIVSGKIKGTDALKLIRETNGEAEFLQKAEEIAKSKIDRRKKENKLEAKNPEERKLKIKNLVINFLGKSPKLKQADELIEALTQI